MEFKELEYILVIAQEKNISKAAERLYVSQPALSRALLRIEDRLGTSLFVRKNRQYLPTAAGELYLDMARTTLNTRQTFERQLKKLMSEKGGNLSLGITPGRARTILPKILPAFREAFPDYGLNICDADIETLERKLREREIEIAFFTMTENGGRNMMKIHLELLAREEIVLCTARKPEYQLLASEKAERKYPWIDLKLLENETFLLLTKNMRLGQFSLEILSCFPTFPKTMYLNSIDTALALVGQQYGVAFASSFRIEEHANAKEIGIFSFGEETPEWDVVAAYPADYIVSRPVRYLMNLVKGLYEK